MDDFSTQIIEQRKRLELTQAELGYVLDVSWITVWRWENKHLCPKKFMAEAIIEKLKGIDYE